MDGNSDKNLNESGELKSNIDEERGKSKLKKTFYKSNIITTQLIQWLYNLFKQPFIKLSFVIIISIIDGIVFFYYGTPNGFRALVSEGTLALAFVTYLQMKKSEDSLVG